MWDTTGAAQLRADGHWPSMTYDQSFHDSPHRLVSEIRAQFGLDVALVRRLASGSVEVEVITPDRCLPAGYGWTSDVVVPPSSGRAAWERPGWIAETLAAVDRELEHLGWRRLGPARQMRHTPITALLRIPTSAGVVWIKGLRELFGHEPAVLQWLHRLAPNAVPEVLFDGPGWWASAAFAEAGPPPREDALDALARLQAVASTELPAAPRQCPHRPITALPDELKRLAAAEHILGDQSRAHLTRILPRLRVICDEVAALGLPISIVHGDFSSQNVRWTAGGWFLYDWTDSCLSHPLADVAMPVLEGRTVDTRSLARAWAWAGPQSCVRRAADLATVVGLAHYAADFYRLTDAIPSDAGDASVGLLLTWLERCVAQLQLAVATDDH